MNINRLFWGLPEEYWEAFMRRVRRNYRSATQELRVLLVEALKEEAEAIRREQEAEQNAKEVSEA
jgi:hypothetical protein